MLQAKREAGAAFQMKNTLPGLVDAVAIGRR